MAAKKTATPAGVRTLVSQIRGSATDARKRFTDEAAERRVAKNILAPDAVAGEVGVSALMTTLGGTLRNITSDDLAAFRRNVGVLKAKTTKNAMRGGIRPLQVVKFSLKEDIERANKQIRMAVMAGGGKDGLLRFVTNAGPGSDRQSHHVRVQLLSWGAAVSSPKKPQALAKWVAGEPVKFDCDCGRHRYWYRYIATIGGWNQGRNEDGFPKIRNPKLAGVACKHVLRVMRELSSGSHIHAQIAKMIETGKPVLTTKAEAEKMAASQAKSRKVISQDAARVRKTAEKFAKAGLASKVPEAQKKAAARAKSGKADGQMAAKAALDRQIAMLKTAGLSESDIRAALTAALKTIGI